MAQTAKGKEPRKGFVMIPNAVIDNANLSARDKLVLIKVASHAYGTSNVANPSQKGTADSLGYRRETVKAAYESLVALKVLEPHGEGRNGRQETFTIDLGRAANLTTQSAGTLMAKPSGNLTSESPGNLTTQSAAPDYSVGINKSRTIQEIHNQENGSATEGVSSRESVGVVQSAGSAADAEPDDTSSAEIKRKPFSDNGRQSPPATLPASPGRNVLQSRPLSKAEINAGFVKPNGYRVSDDIDDLECDLNNALAWVCGEPLNRGTLDRLASQRGVKLCALWAHWLHRKIADVYEKGGSVDKPTAYYVRAVEERWPVDTKWPEFDEKRHTVAAREEAQKRQQKRDEQTLIPGTAFTVADASRIAAEVRKGERNIEDLPRPVQSRVEMKLDELREAERARVDNMSDDEFLDFTFNGTGDDGVSKIRDAESEQAASDDDPFEF